LDSQKHIEFSLQSPFGGGRAGLWAVLFTFYSRSIFEVDVSVSYDESHMPFTRMSKQHDYTTNSNFLTEGGDVLTRRFFCWEENV
jgi:hypothetical protein